MWRKHQHVQTRRYIAVADVAASHIVGLKGVSGIDKLDGNKPIVGADELDVKEKLLNFNTEGKLSISVPLVVFSVPVVVFSVPSKEKLLNFQAQKANSSRNIRTPSV